MCLVLSKGSLHVCEVRQDQRFQGCPVALDGPGLHMVWAGKQCTAQAPMDQGPYVTWWRSISGGGGQCVVDLTKVGGDGETHRRKDFFGLPGAWHSAVPSWALGEPANWPSVSLSSCTSCPGSPPFSLQSGVWYHQGTDYC